MHKSISEKSNPILSLIRTAIESVEANVLKNPKVIILPGDELKLDDIPDMLEVSIWNSCFG